MTVCTVPALSVIVRVMVLPAGRSLVPVIVGVVSLVTTGASTVIAGGVVSITPVSFTVDELPAASVPLAVTV